ncbi:hypothetical protein MBR_07197, partial [Metarhizium brunneum ARSEF 3297]
MHSPSSWESRNWMRSPEVIGSVCAGLVTIDKDSDTVRLVHYTAQTYFERSWTEFFPGAHTNLAKLCLTCYTEIALLHKGYGHGIRAEGPHRLLI